MHIANSALINGRCPMIFGENRNRKAKERQKPKNGKERRKIAIAGKKKIIKREVPAGVGRGEPKRPNTQPPRGLDLV